MKKLRVGVVYGGRSGEHEVSVASAAAVIKHLDKQRYETVPLRIEKDGRWLIPDRPPLSSSTSEVIDSARQSRAPRPGREAHLVAHPGDEQILTLERGETPSVQDGDRATARLTGLALDVIFPVLHGPYGEDGTVQGLLELANVPYVGAGVLSSAVGMDKAVMKRLFQSRNLPIVEHLVILRRDWLADRDAVIAAVADRLGFPMFIKPANLGSSVGISKANDRAELVAGLDHAAEFDRKLIVESAVPDAREIECAILGNDDPQSSVPGEIIPSREFYDYQAKYLEEGSELLIPAPLSTAQSEEVRRLAIEAFLAIDGAGMARVDFLLARGSGALYVNEINTIPGFTTISMYPKLWGATGLSYPALLDRLVDLALARHAEKQQLRTSVM